MLLDDFCISMVDSRSLVDSLPCEPHRWEQLCLQPETLGGWKQMLNLYKWGHVMLGKVKHGK